MNSKERIAKALSLCTDTKVFEMGQGIYETASKVFVEHFAGRKAVVVADVNTWAVLGEKVYENFTNAGIPTAKYIIDKKEFHADWKYVEMVDLIVEGRYDEAKAIEVAAEYEDTDHENLSHGCKMNFLG